MNHVVDWLLEESTPEIRYRTMIELQGRKKDDKEVEKARQNLLKSELIRQTLDKFQEKNKWEHINALLILAEAGLTREDVEIEEAVEFLIKKINKGMKCAKVLMLRNLVALGYYEHPWVKEQIELAFSTIREDGTVHCLDLGKKRNDSRLPDMGCYRQTTTYLLLAAELKKIDVTYPQFDELIDFYLKHQVMYHLDDSDKIIIKEMTGTFYPIDHVHIGLQLIMYSLSILGAGTNENCKKAWSHLHEFETEDGKYTLSESFPEPYFSVGAVGETNKWVTLYMMLAEKTQS